MGASPKKLQVDDTLRAYFLIFLTEASDLPQPRAAGGISGAGADPLRAKGFNEA
jgi:hypothetical protein